MWKVALGLIVTLIVIPVLAFEMDVPLTNAQGVILHKLIIVYLAAAGLCFRLRI